MWFLGVGRTKEKKNVKKEPVASEKIVECQKILKHIFAEDYKELMMNFDNLLFEEGICFEDKSVKLSRSRFCYVETESWRDTDIRWVTDSKDKMSDLSRFDYLICDMIHPQDLFLTVRKTSINLRSGLIVNNGLTIKESEIKNTNFDFIMYHDLNDNNIEDIEFILKNKNMIISALNGSIKERLLRERLDKLVSGQAIGQFEASRLCEKEKRSNELLDMVKSYGSLRVRC